MKIFLTLVLSSILAGLAYAVLPVPNDSDVISSQVVNKLGGSDQSLEATKIPAVEPASTTTLEEDDESEDIDENIDEVDEHGFLVRKWKTLPPKPEGFQPLPDADAGDLYDRVKNVTAEMNFLLQTPQNLASIGDARSGWNLLKETLALLTPQNTGAENFTKLKDSETKMTDQLNSVTAESVGELKLVWVETKKLLDEIVELHNDQVFREGLRRKTASAKAFVSKAVDWLKSWFGPSATAPGADVKRQSPRD